MKEFEDIGGVVLAGGKSERMGQDKATLVFNGKPLIEHMAGILVDAGVAPILVAGQGGEIQDVIKHGGPVAGICGLAEYALENHLPSDWLILPVDMPLLTVTALTRLLKNPGHAANFVSNPLPLMLRFNAETLPFIEAAKRDLEAGRSVSVQRLLSAIGACSVVADGAIAEQIINVNSPEEWQAVQAVAAQ